MQKQETKRRDKIKVPVKISGKHTISSQQLEAEQASKTRVKKSIYFLAIVSLGYLLYLILTGKIASFIVALAGVNYHWIIAGLLCYTAYYFLGVLAYAIPAATDSRYPVGIRDLMSVEATGIFFYNLTPNGAGGAPAQIVRLTRSGLSVGAAGTLQYTRFIMYEAGEGIFAAIMLLFRYTYFIETYGDVYLIGVALFGFKILEVAALLLICLLPNAAIKCGNGFIFVASKLRLMKRTDHWHYVINTQIIEFSTGFKIAVKNVKEMMLTLVVTLVQLGCMYALPWFVLNAFHIEADLITCLAAGSMLELLTSAIPLPGGTGGAEGGFAFLFQPMFGAVTPAGFVVWRMIEYFLPIMVSALLMGLRSNSGKSIYERYNKKLKKLQLKDLKSSYDIKIDLSSIEDK